MNFKQFCLFDNFNSLFTIHLVFDYSKKQVSGLRPATLLKKETLAQVLSCGFCEFYDQEYLFYRTPAATVSVLFPVKLTIRIIPRGTMVGIKLE